MTDSHPCVGLPPGGGGYLLGKICACNFQLTCGGEPDECADS